MKMIALLMTFFSFGAVADVIFIDLNNVDKEIQAVRQELASRRPPEKLILLPLDHDSYTGRANKVKDLVINIDQNLSQLGSPCERAGNCAQVRDNIKKAEAERDSIKKTLNYGADDLKKDLSTIPGDSVSSVMVSGHHIRSNSEDPSQFWGALGNIHVDGDKSFVSAFKDFNKKNISSIYLLGCRSAIPEDLGGVWKTNFPNASYIVGYENTGFLQENPNSWAFIRKAMASEKQILASSSTETALKKFKSISPKNSTYGTAACLTIGNAEPRFYSSSSNSSEDLASKLNCPSSSEKIQVAIDYMNCINRTGGESAACSLKDISKSKVLTKKECDFKIPDQVNEAMKLRNQQKVLDYLMDPGAKISFSSLAAKAPDFTKKEVALTANPSNLNIARKQVEAIKSSIDKKLNSPDIFDPKKFDIAALNELAAKKEVYDKLSEAMGNLDISKYSEAIDVTEARATDKGGLLRAIAFERQNSNNLPAYQARIQQVQSELQEAPGGPIRSALRKELDALESFSSKGN